LVLQGIDPAKVQRAKRYCRPNAATTSDNHSAMPQAS
jgi:hypothetical protein